MKKERLILFIENHNLRLVGQVVLAATPTLGSGAHHLITVTGKGESYRGDLLEMVSLFWTDVTAVHE